MVMVAFDTSSDFLSVAVGDKKIVRAMHERVGHAHAERLLGTIQQFFDAVGATYADIEAVAFGAGPGAFTGLRIACGVAQGLGFAMDRPLIAVGAFEAIAAGARERDPAVAAVRVAIDARMGEVYTALVVHGSSGWTIAGEAQALAPALVPHDGDVGAGSGFAAYPDLAIGRSGRVFADLVPAARLMLGIAGAALARGEVLDPALAAPVYVRDRVALTTVERRAQAAAR